MCALNIIVSISFGKRLSQTDKSLFDLAKNFQDSIFSKSRQIDYCQFLRFVPSYKRAFQEVINWDKEQFKFIDNGIARSLSCEEDSFSRSFIEKYKGSYDHQELRYIFRDILIAGSETTGTSLQWAMVYLANYQEVQKRLHAEIDKVLPERRPVSLSNMGEMPYLEATILEISRIKPAVPLALAHLTLQDSEIGGYFIPAGTTIIPLLYAIHNNPDEWPEPEVFKPERFFGFVRKRCWKGSS